MTGRKPHTTDAGQFGYVYLIRNPRTGFYKIGSARRPTTRLATLSREMATKCELVHTIATNESLRLEREIQGRVIASMIGGEWYELDDVQLAAIMGVSTVFYRDSEAQPRSRLRSDFDAGAPWAKRLPVCGEVRN
jgi:hypothetical protein